MKIKKQEKIIPIKLNPNDTITLEYIDPFGDKTTVLQDEIGKEMTINEAVIFEVEKGDFAKNVKQ